MKLISKISFNYFIITFLVLLAGGIAAYFFIRAEVDEKIDFKLQSEREHILRHASTRADLTSSAMNISSYLEVTPARLSGLSKQLKDTLLYNVDRHRFESFRQLSFQHTLDGQTVQIILRKNLVESRDLREGLSRSLLIIFLALLVILMGTNYFLSKKIWSYFNHSILEINQYDLAKHETLELPSTRIEELEELNRAVNRMAAKIRSDFISLKEFSENASHEIQTPLAVIKSKIELLLQHEDLNSEQMTHVRAIDRAAAKLSHLNQSLLLLTKIENRQFVSDSEVDLKSILERQVAEIEELTQLQQITVTKLVSESIKIRMNSVLADVMVRNLLNNAIRYCTKPGEIRIELNAEHLLIANSGEPLKMPAEQIFDRFKKDNQSSEALGLGLAIVKKICELDYLDLLYRYEDAYHVFEIRPHRQT